MTNHKQPIYHDLHIFLSIAGVLLIIGCLFVYSSSAIFAFETFGDSHYFLKRQLLGITLGMVGLLIARFIPILIVHKLTPFLLFLSLGLTGLTLYKPWAVHIHGSSRWLKIAGFAFQPSELLKIAFILYLGYFFSLKNRTKSQFLLLAFICILMSGILLMQPDFGLTMTLLSTVLLLLFITHTFLMPIFCLVASLIAAAVCLISMQPYRLQRITTFLDPWKDPQGKGFQIIQSFIAIGSGGWLGNGIAHSKQKFFYLPMQHTDFIFSIIAEETGFIGCLLLIALFIAFIYFGIRIACKLKNSFSTFTIISFVLLMGLQSIINIAVATGLAPTKGIGLPLVSYGNTSLVCTLTMLGLIINMVHDDHWIV